MEITTALLLHWLRRTATTIRAQREYLTELDAAIGDSDHGHNLDRGFAAVVENLPALEYSDAGAILKSSGMRLISTVGGASGPLYGTAFRRAGQMLEGRMTITVHEIHEAFDAFVTAIANLGKASPGDKTMLDALVPALDALKAKVACGATFAESMQAAADAARAGAEATIPLVARRGRASYLGERSAGHQDPGATSAALILQAFADVLAQH
jgi:phosphoenolpyruvate---glycerone phosphotransferase subunit DhaL